MMAGTGLDRNAANKRTACCPFRARLNARCCAFQVVSAWLHTRHSPPNDVSRCIHEICIGTTRSPVRNCYQMHRSCRDRIEGWSSSKNIHVSYLNDRSRYRIADVSVTLQSREVQITRSSDHVWDLLRWEKHESVDAVA